jgi:hypothetical protein
MEEITEAAVAPPISRATWTVRATFVPDVTVTFGRLKVVLDAKCCPAVDPTAGTQL